MILKHVGKSLIVEGTEFFVGMEIVATDESEYVGLKGHITEIRTDSDKDMENEGPDIYCAFIEPEDPQEIAGLEDTFSELYGEPKKLEDICLDCVIMAPSMIRASVTV